MILLQRYDSYVEILCSRKLRLTALVDEQPEELVVFDKPTDNDTRFFGCYYMLEARKDQHITINSTGGTYEFKAK